MFVDRARGHAGPFGDRTHLERFVTTGRGEFQRGVKHATPWSAPAERRVVGHGFASCAKPPVWAGLTAVASQAARSATIVKQGFRSLGSRPEPDGQAWNARSARCSV